jgi:MTH538 TIR-like domain (DUF1863)
MDDRREVMADPRAFISFDFDHDEAQRVLFAGQSSNSSTPFSIQNWSSKTMLEEDEWEDLLRAKINVCHLMVVLVGEHMATASGVAKEISMAKAQDVPFFGVYVDGAGSSTTLPAGLARGRTISWTWDGVAAAITQMMGEGKNS